MLKKLSYRFFILFLLSCICINTYTFTKSEAADFGASVAIQYFVDFAVSYLGYSFDKTDRVDIANSLIQKYKEINGSITNLIDTARKTLFLSLCKSYAFLKDKVKEFDQELKSCINLVADIVLVKVKSFSDTINSNEYIKSQSIDFNNVVMSDWSSFEDIHGIDITYRMGVISSAFNPIIKLRRAHFYSSGDYDVDSVLPASFYSFERKILKDNGAIFHFSMKKASLDWEGDEEAFYITDKFHNMYFNYLNDPPRAIYFFSDSYLKLCKFYCEYIKNGKVYSQVFYADSAHDITMPNTFIISYLYDNNIYQNSNIYREQDLKSFSEALNTSPEIKEIARNMKLYKFDYNKVVDQVISQLKNTDNLALDSTNNQVLQYFSDNVIGDPVDVETRLTGSDVVNLNVDKLLDRSLSIGEDVKANNSLLKNIYDVVSNSRESILKLASDLALTNTKAINLARDLADIKAKTDVISSDTYADTLSDKISTSVSKSIDATISKNFDSRFNDKKDKHLNLKPLKNLIIKEKFPFSLPFDLKDSFTVMKSKQIIPKFDLAIKGYHMTVDFAMFDSLVKKARPFFLLMFCIFLILVSKKVLS